MKKAGPRDYSDQRKGEISGTADHVVAVDGLLTVDDWKTGRGDIGERPRDHLQMLFLGLAAARAHGVNSVRIRYLLVSEEGITPVHDDLDEFALSAIAVRLRKLVAGIGQSPPKPGPHCYSKYCPIVATCPATKAALAAIDTASALEHPLSVEITSPEHAASVRVRLKMVRSAVDAIETALKAYVKETGPIPIGGGKVYGFKREQSVERLDIATPGAYAALVAHLGQEGADQAVTLDATKASIHKATKDRAVEKELLEQLRGLGAFRTPKPFDRFEEWEMK